MEKAGAQVGETLRQCPLFHGVGRGDREWLLSCPGCRARPRPKGSIVAFRGDAYDRLLLVLSGSLTAELQDFRGQVLKVETLRAREVVAPAILFAADNLLPVTLTAAEDSLLLELPRDAVLALLQRSPPFLLNYLRAAGSRLVLLAEKLYLQRFASIRQRIAGYLLDQADKQATDSPQLKVSKEGLAEIFGVTRPSLSRAFGQLRRQGLIHPEGRTVHILDRAALEAATGGD